MSLGYLGGWSISLLTIFSDPNAILNIIFRAIPFGLISSNSTSKSEFPARTESDKYYSSLEQQRKYSITLIVTFTNTRGIDIKWQINRKCMG